MCIVYVHFFKYSINSLHYYLVKGQQKLIIKSHWEELKSSVKMLTKHYGCDMQ